MKHLKLYFSIIALIVSLAVPFRTYAAEAAAETYTVTALSLTCYANSEKGLRVRSGPSTDYDVLGTLSYGAEIEVTGECDGWYALSYHGTTGFVSAKYTSTEAPADAATDKSSTSETASTEVSTEKDTAAEEETLTIFGNSTLVILLIAIMAVIVLIVLSIASFFKKPSDASYEEYEEDYPDEEYGNEDYEEDYADDEYPDEEYEYDDDDDEY